MTLRWVSVLTVFAAAVQACARADSPSGGTAAGAGGIENGHAGTAGGAPSTPEGASGERGVAGSDRASPSEWAHCGANAPPSNCSIERTCEAARGCDDVLGPFLDSRGCMKPDCESSADCAEGSLCASRQVRTPQCQSSGLEDCSVDFDGTCFCSAYADCSGRAFCIPDTTQLCDTEDLDCDTLAWWQDDLRGWPSPAKDDELNDQATTCLATVTSRLSELGCDSSSSGTAAGAGGIENGHAGTAGGSPGGAPGADGGALGAGVVGGGAGV
jgi:hypothetical protein